MGSGSSRGSAAIPVAGLLAGLLACVAAKPERPADAVLRGGRIYTLDPERPWARAIAFRDVQPTEG
jgi:hypothetical protein